MNRALTAVLIIVIWLLLSFPAKPLAQTNGCGAWGSGFLIPELWFTDACNEHDMCLQEGAPMVVCNEVFHKAIRVSCEMFGEVCQRLGEVYYTVVEIARRVKYG